MYRNIDQSWEVTDDKPNDVVEWARKFLTDRKTTSENGVEEKPMIEILREIIKEKPNDWCVGLHFDWGMWFRNQMRENGFDDKTMGCNLDDIYVGIVEKACLESTIQ